MTRLKAVDTPVEGENTLQRIERYIANPPENSRIFLITPEIAAHILETRFTEKANNRSAAVPDIQKLANHMAAHNWKLTGDTVKFSKSGRLSDGQHRFKACVRSGTPFLTHIVFGIADDAFDFMDVGRKRTPAHMLQIAGFKNTGRMAAAIRWAYLLEEGRAKSRETLEPEFVVKLAQTRYVNVNDDNKGLTEFIAIGARVHKIYPLMPDTLVAALLYVFTTKNKQKAKAFAEGWADGIRTGDFTPIKKANFTLEQIDSAASGRIHDVVRAALLVRAWNAFVGKRVGTIKHDFTWNKDMPFPEIKG